MYSRNDGSSGNWSESELHDVDEAEEIGSLLPSVGTKDALGRVIFGVV